MNRSRAWSFRLERLAKAPLGCCWALLVAVHALVLSWASAAQADDTDPVVILKKQFACNNAGVLCIDACTGNVLATYDGPSAQFTVANHAKLHIRVVGYCKEQSSDVKYSVSVSYASNPDTVLKNTAQPVTVAPTLPATPVVNATRIAADQRPGDPGARAALVTAQGLQQTQARQALTLLQSLSDTVLALDGASSDHVGVVRISRSLVDGSEAPAPVAVDPSVVAETPLNWPAATASYVLRQGIYVVDFGVGMAVVPRGLQTVTAAPYRGNANDLRLSTEANTASNVLFSVFLYPAGHPRDTVLPWTSGYNMRGLPVVHVATELARETFLRSLYLGAGIEPVSGINVVLGAALVPVTTYRNGAQPGTAVDSSISLSSVTRQVMVVRPYLAVSASTEIFNSAKAAYTALF